LSNNTILHTREESQSWTCNLLVTEIHEELLVFKGKQTSVQYEHSLLLVSAVLCDYFARAHM